MSRYSSSGRCDFDGSGNGRGISFSNSAADSRPIRFGGFGRGFPINRPLTDSPLLPSLCGTDWPGLRLRTPTPPTTTLPPSVVDNSGEQQRQSIGGDNWVRRSADSSWRHGQQPNRPSDVDQQTVTPPSPLVSPQPPRPSVATSEIIREARKRFKSSVHRSYMNGVMRFCGEFPNDCDFPLSVDGCTGLQLAVRKAIDIAATQDDTPLRSERIAKCADIVKFLLMRGCDPTRPNNLRQSVVDDLLQCVTAQGCPSASRLALFKLLFPASTSGTEAIITPSYVPLVWRRNDGETLLHLAARNHAWDCLTFMLSIVEIKQTLIDIQTVDTLRTPLHYVIRNRPNITNIPDAEEVLNYRVCLAELVLCADGAKLDATGLAPIHTAVINGQAWLVQELIESDELALYYCTGDGNNRSRCEHTALALAAAHPYSHVDVLCVVLDRLQRLGLLEAQVNAQCKCGTPLLHSLVPVHNCVSRMIPSVLPSQGVRSTGERILLQKLVVFIDRCSTALDLNRRDARGNTMLHLITKAVRHVRVGHVDFLTDADYLLRQCTDRQPLNDVGGDDGILLACCLYLIAHGADPTIRNDAGVTAVFPGLHTDAAALMNRFHDIRRYGKVVDSDSDSSALMRVVDAAAFVTSALGPSLHVDGCCIICQENRAVVFYRPCGHRHLCIKCARRAPAASLRCTTCKKPVEQLVDSGTQMMS